jgi:hypothetical protein
MTGFSRICLIRFGEVGQILADDLAVAANRQDWAARHKSAAAEAELGALLDHVLRRMKTTGEECS